MSKLKWKLLTKKRVLDPDSSPRHVGETRGYLHNFIASRAHLSTARELYETMLSLYPNRLTLDLLGGREGF